MSDASFVPKLQKLIIEKDINGQATLLGGYCSKENSKKLKEAIESILRSTGYRVRKLWGKSRNIGCNAYFSRKGSIWISLGYTANMDWVRQGLIIPIKPINTEAWLQNAFSEVVLLPEDKLFIGNSEKPLFTGPYNCGRIAI